jgi:hypothetical protein
MSADDRTRAARRVARAEVARLTPRWRAYWPGADAGAAGRDVVARLAGAVRAWDLEEVRALAGGNVALVCAAARHGRPVVVKVHARGHAEERELRAEAAALAFWQPTGAVPELLGRRDDDLTVLMARVVPGTPLERASLSFDARLTLLGGLARRLHEAGPAPGDALPLEAYAASWRRALERDPASLATLDRLLAPAPTDVLVHADLHAGNALLAGDGWRAIDPHAARADRHADVWALLDPLVPPLPGDPAQAARTARARVARYAQAAGLDPGRAAVWARVRARATAAGLAGRPAPSAADLDWAARLRRMAGALEEAGGRPG